MISKASVWKAGGAERGTCYGLLPPKRAADAQRPLLPSSFPPFLPSSPPPFLLSSFPPLSSSLLLSSLLPLLLSSLLALPALAQDTTRTPADTLRADTSRQDLPRAPRDTTLRDTTQRDTVLRDTTEQDTLQRVPPRRDTLAADTLQSSRQRTLSLSEAMELETPRPGRALSERPPVRDPALDVTELLARVPSAFRYDLGGVGWPHGVSFFGRPPDQTTLTLNGLPFDDLLTGRPRYDLLPMPFIEPLHRDVGALGAPGAVGAQIRPYDEGRPLTELRYRTGDFQSIGALHTQRRKVNFFGSPAFAKFTGGYYGRASDNTAFLGQQASELRRERRLLGRIRYRRRSWALELTALHNRRRIGASGGVALNANQPLGRIFLPNRSLRSGQARRRLLRTDLAATLRLQTPLAASPLTATTYWTAQTHRYRNPALPDSLPFDTVAAETDRYGLRLSQRATLRTESFGRHDLTLEAHAWTDRSSEGNALPEEAARAQLHLSARDSTHLLGSEAVLGAGLHAGPVQTYPSASARLTSPALANTLRFFLEGRLAGQSVSWIEEDGFGPLVQPLPAGSSPGPVLAVEAGGQGALGPVDLRLALFGDYTVDRLDLYATNASDTIRAVVNEGASQRVGATLSARWRFQAERGFYATASATSFLSNNGSSNGGPSPAPRGPVVPRVHGQGRLGARYAFFTEDLDVDAYVRGRFWSSMQSRALHAPTGRLVIPPPGSRPLGPSGVIDLHAEAQIRTATLFFTYENALSGTSVQLGTLNVPLYPLPEQQFRFGVYWPIFN